MGVQNLKESKIGQLFNGICVIRSKELKHRNSGEAYLRLELGDSSGRLSGNLWKNSEKLDKVLKKGQFVEIKGKVRIFKNRKVLDIDKIHPLKKENKIPEDSFLPISQKDVERLKRQFHRHKNSIKNFYLQNLLDQVFADELFLEDFLKLPSGKLWHHQYLYGNLEHMICLLDLCNVIKIHYPNLNTDLTKTAIFLRGLGNAEVIESRKIIDYTTKGRLWGSTFIGAQRILYYIKRIPEFPKDLMLHLLHLILSQSSGPYRTTEIPPMTREAVILKQLITLDIQANAVERIIKNDRVENSNWTTFNNLLNRFIYTASPEMTSGESV
jgi:3'-5' exoribonuclease